MQKIAKKIVFLQKDYEKQLFQVKFRHKKIYEKSTWFRQRTD